MGNVFQFHSHNNFSIRWHFDVVAVIDIPFPAGSCFLSKQRPTQPTNPESKITFTSERFSQNCHNFTQIGILQLKDFKDASNLNWRRKLNKDKAIR